MADGDIDLYADVEGDFASSDFDNGSKDLYDDVLSQTKDEKPGPQNPKTGTANSSAPVTATNAPGTYVKKHQLYIGNLTWWTTDNDITEAVMNAGVTDFQEVKFNENRINGQSKGFCCITLGSEASMKIVMEKIPRIQLHGQTPVVTYATKSALMQFEAQSNTRAPPPPSQHQSSTASQAPPRPTAAPPPVRGYAPPRIPFTRAPPPTAVISGPPPMIHQVPPPITSAVLPPVMLQHVAPPPVLAGLPPRGPPPAIIHPAGPAPHVNPAFFSQAPPPGFPTVSAHGLSEAEFEEIMSRNRTVSSSAISRAVQDAANGDYTSAIETLVTAISLIKQSKVASDDRCKILVSTLQDTLTGIENKSYSRRSRSRERDRAYRSSHRSYSREHDYRPREYRDRSRERERDYYRDREYYEERHRYKERDREGGSRGRSGEEVDMRQVEREKERPRH